MGSIIIPALLVFTGSPVLFGWAKPVPYNPYNLRNQRWGEAIVAVAGSATNLLLAVIFALVARAVASDPTAASFAATVCFVNLFLGLFNLIPFPPMDGFTVLRGILPYRLSYSFHRFENSIRAWGPVAIFIVLIVFAYIFATPFYDFVSWIFNFLVGNAG
jgi:Zn-dependent protease